MIPLIMKINKKHRETLLAIFEKPTRPDVRWNDFASMVAQLGGTIEVGGRTSGSRRRVRLNGRRAVFHKPHPSPCMVKGSVESARDFLTAAGVTPE